MYTLSHLVPQNVYCHINSQSQLESYIFTLLRLFLGNVFWVKIHFIEPKLLIIDLLISTEKSHLYTFTFGYTRCILSHKLPISTSSDSSSTYPTHLHRNISPQQIVLNVHNFLPIYLSKVPTDICAFSSIFIIRIQPHTDETGHT